jgi:hypothetical protein
VGAISRDLSSTGMTAAIEASCIAIFEHWSRSARIEVHDEAPDLLRWYVTPEVPDPLFNHVYYTRLAQDEDVDARIEGVLESFAEHQVPFMWSVGPFTRPPELGSRLESHGLSLVDDLAGMAVDLRALEEDVPVPSSLSTERVSDTGVLKECVEVMRVGFGMPEFICEAFFDVFSAVGLTEDSPWRSYLGRLDGEAVTASSLVLAAGVAGIYNVTTLPGRGGEAWVRR